MKSIDNNIFQELNKLKDFITFLESFPQTTKKQKQASQIIFRFIDKLNTALPTHNWEACLNIYDHTFNLPQDPKREDVTWRSWSVYYGNGSIEIEAKSHHSEMLYYDGHFQYYAGINFIKTESYITKPLDLFIEDAKNYQSYITKHLNDVEVDIDVY